MPIRVGLVGLGDAGCQHALALARLDERGACTWAAIVGREPARVQAFRSARGVPDHAQSFASLAALLDAGGCDAVILATPDHLHAEQLRDCVERGVHVLVEKPLALACREVEATLERAHAERTLVRVGYHLRHHAGHRLVHARREPLIGALERVDLLWAWPDPGREGWRAQGQAGRWSLAALGVHGIDLARWFAGSEPRRVVALREPAQGVDRRADLTLDFGRVVAHVAVSIEYRARSRLVLTGARGEIECRGTLGARGEGEIRVHAPMNQALPVSPLPFTPENPYGAQLEDFLAALRAGESTDVAGNLANVAILESIP